MNQAMIDEVMRTNERSRKQLFELSALTFVPSSLNIAAAEKVARAAKAAPMDLIVTANEINQRHGTGVLLRKIFSDQANIATVRSRNDYQGDHSFGQAAFCLPQSKLSRNEILSLMLDWFPKDTVRRILCIPFYREDLMVAIAVKEIHNAPLCVYIMDDQNVAAKGIDDSLMEEALSKASLRLAISTDMLRAYEKKYGKKFWLMPPVVSASLIQTSAAPPDQESNGVPTGVLAGNIWGQRWLDLLRETVRGSGFRVHWYCNGGLTPSWLSFDRKELEENGIIMFDSVPESELARILRKHPFAILPSGTLDERDNNRSIASLSLPTRVPFILAASNTPIIVLGSPDTAAARFVRHFGVGTSCAYDKEAFRKAVEEATEPQTQLTMRRNACAMAAMFSDDGMAEWLWKSLEQGEPPDARFEPLMSMLPTYSTDCLAPPVFSSIQADLVLLYHGLRRLKRLGFTPDFVVDMDASSGAWSRTVHQVFPGASFVLMNGACSNRGDSAQDALLADCSNFATVKPTSLDILMEEHLIRGRGLVRMSTPCVQRLALEEQEAARERIVFRQQVGAAVVRLGIDTNAEQLGMLSETVSLMHELGLRYFDDAGESRCPQDGTLRHKDGLFVRQDLFQKPETA